MAADILPLERGALVVGWTTRADSAADALVLRVDDDGRQLWRRHLGIAPGAELLFSVQRDGTDGFVAAGLTTSRGEGGDGWLVGLDRDGRLRWERNEGGPGHDRLTSIVPLSAGDGWLAAGQLARGRDTDAWVLRTDRAGRPTAHWTWGDTAHVERAFGVEATADGGAVIAGLVEPLGASAEADGIVVRLDCDGHETWRHAFGGPGRQLAYHLRTDPGGDFLVTGYGAGAGTAGAGGGARLDPDAIVLRLAADGRERWRRAIGDSATERGVQALPLADGSSVLLGYARPSSSADDRPVWTTFLAGLDAEGATRWRLPLGGAGRESGRWIAGTLEKLWVVGQEAGPAGSSRIFVARLRRAAP